jgi:hypothetical protein
VTQETPDRSEPPADPEEWSDEQWLAWLVETDGDYEEWAAQPRVSARWRDRSTSQALGAAMLGLQYAIYGRPDDEAVIFGEAPSGPPDDESPVVNLDPDHPERSQVIVRSRSDKSDPDS